VRSQCFLGSRRGTVALPGRRNGKHLTEALGLLRTEPRARLFFSAFALSSLGTGAAYPALLVIAYARYHSPWAISLILLADFVPSGLVGPVLGAVVDRWPRLWCAAVADVIRAAAFVGIAVVGSFEATLALAVLGGVGKALFRPAVLAEIPSMVRSDRSAAATSLYGALNDFGMTGGPAIAAAAFLVVGSEELLVANGATFALSALVLARLAVGREGAAEAGDQQPSGRSLLREAREGLSTSLQMPGTRVVMFAFAVGMFFGGVFNVIELPFATDALGTGVSGYSVLITVYGVGFVAGSLRGARGGQAPHLKRMYLAGLLLTGVGSLAAGASFGLAMGIGAFAVGGFGNGLAVVHQRLLFQSEVDSGLQGRLFAVADSLMAWGFAVGFLAAGAMAVASSPRTVMLFIGAGEIALAAVAAAALRRHWVAESGGFAVPARTSVPSAALTDGAGPLRHAEVREQGPHLVDGTLFWLTLLDDIGKRADNGGVELRPGVSD
jgi:MFS family permease